MTDRITERQIEAKGQRQLAREYARQQGHSHRHQGPERHGGYTKDPDTGEVTRLPVEPRKPKP